MRSGSDAQPSVDEAVGRAQKGDAAAFAVLYEDYYDRIFRYVSFKTGNSLEAEDITAEVFVKMLESIDSFRWQGYQFSSWLFRIAHNLVVDHFRKRGRRHIVALDDAPAAATEYNPDLDRKLDVDMSMVPVQEAMKDLTDLQREVISLRFAAGLSVAETARAVGKKDNAVKALQHAGIKKLRGILSARGLRTSRGPERRGLLEDKRCPPPSKTY